MTSILLVESINISLTPLFSTRAERRSKTRRLKDALPRRMDQEGERERPIHLHYIMHHSHHHQCTEEVHEENSGCVVYYTPYNVCSRCIFYRGMCEMRGSCILSYYTLVLPRFVLHSTNYTRLSWAD